MKNYEIAKIFEEIAGFLRLEGVAFKPYAYEKAAASLRELGEDVAGVYIKGGRKSLEEIPAIGKAMSDHIEEYIKTGKIKFYEEFKKTLPVNMDELMKVEGLGMKKIKVLYEQLGVKNVKDLERVAKKHQIAPLFGFGETTEKNILQGIEFLKTSHGRVPILNIKPVALSVLEKLKNLPEVKKVSLAGSLRRGRETIGDVDFLVVSKNPKKTMDYFVSLPGVKKVWGEGKTKASVHMEGGFDMDLRVVPEKSYGSALQYFTGSQAHNIATRKIAISQGLKLSEYGVFRGEKYLAGKSEKEVYEALGLAYVEPEMREDQGEIEAVLSGALPKLIELKDIKGDLHVHSNWGEADGNSPSHKALADKKDSIEALVKKAMDLGYEYLGISDHTRDITIETSLHEKDLLEQNEYIKNLNLNFKKQNVKFRILHGCEANIRKDGSVDIKDEVLEKLDYVIAGVHSLLKMDKKEMTDRIIKAMENPHVDILAHPTGRVIGERDEYQIDFDAILKTAKETGTILEINASLRLDLRDLYIRRAKQEGVKMIINTDAHKKDQMDAMEYGVLQARRGWAEKKDVINALPVEELLKNLK